MKHCLLLAFALGAAAQAATITSSTPQSSYNANEAIPVDVSISNVTDLYAFQFDLAFDPAVLSAQSVSEDGYFSSNGVAFLPGTVDNTAGTISFIADTLSGSGPGFTGSTQLATITFTALADGITSISPTELILLDSTLSEISAGTAAATVNVLGTAPVPEPTSLGLVSTVLGVGLIAFLGPYLRQVRRHSV